MKVSYEEGLANRFGLARRGGFGNGPVLSVRSQGERRPAIELRHHQFRVPILSGQGEGEIGRFANGENRSDAAESENLSMRGNLKRENREILFVPCAVSDKDGSRTSLRVSRT